MYVKPSRGFPVLKVRGLNSILSMGNYLWATNYFLTILEILFYSNYVTYYTGEYNTLNTIQTYKTLQDKNINLNMRNFKNNLR